MGKTTAQSADPMGASAGMQPVADPVPVALDFLRACREERRPLAIVTGAPGTGKSMLMHRFLRHIEGAPVAHLTMPTDSAHEFLEELLGQFGFDTFESTVADLRNLTTVFLAHESGKGLHPLVVVEHVQRFGPAIWNTIRDLAIPAADEKSKALFVLTGSPNFDSASIAPTFDSVYSLDVTIRTSVVSEPPPRDTLEVSFREQPFGRYQLDKAKTTIGRHGANDVRISGSFVSRYHAVIMRESGGLRLVDLSSTNGTFVNGHRIKSVMLEPGDVVSIEDFELRYDSGANRASPSAEQPVDEEPETLVMQAPLDHLLDRSA